MPILGGVVLLLGYAFRLNVLSSGEEEARTLGVKVVRDRTIIVVTVAVICASVVSVAGIIGWVGLGVVPHVARMLVGPDHTRLLPASALLGAAYLTLVDMLTPDPERRRTAHRRVDGHCGRAGVHHCPATGEIPGVAP